MKKTLFSVLLVFLFCMSSTLVTQAKTYSLPATPDTVYSGYFDNSRPPVLKIKSGDIVNLSTMMLYEDNFKPGLTINQMTEIRTILKAQGKGSNTITGPIYIDGAEPGDVLEVRILKLVPRPYAMAYFYPGSMKAGVLYEDYPEGYVKHFSLDLKNKTTELKPGVEIPVRPFLGCMGVAPKAPGKFPIGVPEDFGGNIDCKELVEGSTLYLPVFIEGALFGAGDAHAAMGNGEVSDVALESAMSEVVLQFIVRKDMELERPFAETKTHWITLAFNKDLYEAGKTATKDMIDFLVKNKGLTPSEAYVLCTGAMDLNVTQMVDGNNGIHAMLAKSIFKAK